VALPRIGFNEGSLLRRTLLHVAGFVLGSSAFIGIVSLILVTVAKGLVTPHAATATDDEPPGAGTSRGAAANAPFSPGAAGAPAPLARPAPMRAGRRPGLSAVPARSD
jgi:hypothetical protein